MSQQLPTIGVVVAPGEPMPPGLDGLDGRARLVLVDTAAELSDVLESASVLVVYDFRTRLLREVDWPAETKLTWIHAASAGVDAILVPPVVERQPVVTNSRGYFDRPIAEYVLGLMLVVTKDLLRTRALQHEGRWQHRDARMLHGQRLLVVGAGAIGHEIGRLASAAGMHVEGIAREARDQPPFEQVFESDALLDRLPGADFVAIAAPLTPETRRMFDARAFHAMKDTAWLINVGRGQIVDQDALLQALRAGDIAGAALDVFEEEPLPAGHPFWSMEQVIVSPHMSADTEGWVANLGGLFIDNFDRWLRNEPLRNVVDLPCESSFRG